MPAGASSKFLTANVRNANTHKACARAASEFVLWGEEVALTDLRNIEPVHVAAYVDTLFPCPASSASSYTWPGCVGFLTGLPQPVFATNSASSVRTPKHPVGKGKALVLAAEEARALMDDSIDITARMGLPDRALIGRLVCTFAGVGAALKKRVEIFSQRVARRRTAISRRGHATPTLEGARKSALLGETE